MIRVLHVAACPVGFNLICDRFQHGGMLKLVKNDQFLVFLAIWVLFPTLLGRLRSDLY